MFIHLAILKEGVTTGDKVAELAEADWKIKFKTALDVNERETKMHFDKLVVIRRQLRNFMAHGAFGKQGGAFRFHSGAGGSPRACNTPAWKGPLFPKRRSGFEEEAALKVIDRFIEHLWSGAREPARIYLAGETTAPDNSAYGIRRHRCGNAFRRSRDRFLLTV